MTGRADLHVADPLDPVRATIAAMARRPGQPPVNGLAPALTVTDRDGWVSATTLTSGDGLDALFAAAAGRWRGAPHVNAAVAWRYYTYWVALPAVLGFATGRRVPLLRPDAVLLRWSQPDPFLMVGLGPVEVAVLASDPLARQSPASRRAMRVRVVPDEDALLAAVRTSLVDEHLGPLVRQIGACRHLGQRTLWGSLASGIAHGVSRAAGVAAGATWSTAQQLLRALDLDDLVEITPRADGGLDVHRRTCCLAFALPEPTVCRGCVIG